MSKRIPKGRVRRMVWLDRDALMWAIAVVKDERTSVENRGAMTPDWLEKYMAAEAHLVALVAASERS